MMPLATWTPGSDFPILGFEDILDKLLKSPPTPSAVMDPCPEEECVMIGVCIWGDTRVACDREYFDNEEIDLTNLK